MVKIIQEEISDPHNYQIRIDGAWKLIKSDFSKYPKQIQNIQNYENKMIAEGVGKPANLQKHLKILLSLTRKLIDINAREATRKDWSNLTVQECNKLVSHIMKEHGVNNTETAYTYDHKQILMLFMRFLITGHRKFKKGGNPDVISNIEFGKIDDEINASDLLTPDEIEDLLIACETNDRDRAFLSVLAESGLRISEILGLKIIDVEINDQTKDGEVYKTLKLYVKGKTGRRGVTIAEYSVPYLLRWMEIHTERENTDAPLFPILEGKHKGLRGLQDFEAICQSQNRT